MPDTTTTIERRREELPLADRSMELRSFQRAAEDASGGNAPLATAELVFTTGAAVKRYDWFRERYYLEQLVVEDGAMRLDRMKRGVALLNSHSSWDIEDQLGVVENPVIEAGQGIADVSFSRRESVAGYVQDVADRIIRSVSVGYVRHAIEMVPPVNEGELWVYRVVDWEPYEVSLVAIPADSGSQIRSDGQRAPSEDDRALERRFPCDFIEHRSLQVSPTVGITAATSTRKENSMPGNTAPGGAPATGSSTATLTDEQRAAQAETERANTEAAQRAQQAEQQRSAEITDVCTRHAVGHLSAGLIRSGGTVEAARAAVLEELARRDAASGGHRNVRIETVSDEQQTRMAGIQEALMSRIDPRAQLTDNGRQYRGMSLVEIGRDMLEAAGHSTRGLSRLEIAGRMLQVRSTGYQGTSDFSSLLSNVAGRRLRDAYAQSPTTYQMWARRAPNAPDFKDITVVQLSGAPELLRTNEHGEFTYGTLKDGAETYKVVTYGRIVALTRQAIVNDDLRGFDRLLQAFGDSARRLENRLVYAQLTDNPTMSDGVALFHATHGNLGTAGTVFDDITKLGTARTAMRKQTGMQGELLNIAPRYLIVPASLEQTAYQFTSSNYVPIVPGQVNEFRTGGRTALEPVVEPLLDANSATAWYLAADSAQIDTVEYAYLDGAEGPVIESEMGFEVDGVSFKARLDFAAKATDYRGLRKSTGAA